MAEGERRVEAFISFSREDADHLQDVARLAALLEAKRIAVTWDEPASPQVWPEWMTEKIEAADYVLLLASAGYKNHGSGLSGGGEPLQAGRGVVWEARLLRDLLFNDPNRFRQKVLPVVLPGQSPDDFPSWLTPRSRHHFDLKEISAKEIDPILRLVLKRSGDPPGGGGRPGQAPAAEEPAGDLRRARETFAGRHAALREIASWLRDRDNHDFLLVTSGPGSGKTALLGLIAYLGGGFRHQINIKLPGECIPPRDSIDIALSVRNMVPGAVLARLAQAAGMAPAAVDTDRTARPLAEEIDAFIDYLRAEQKHMTVLLDALDEISIPKEGEGESSNAALDDFIRELLRPLMEAADSPVRFLLGGRSQVVSRMEFGLRGENRNSKIIDLDQEVYQDYDALRKWIRTVLRGEDPQGHPSPWSMASKSVVQKAVNAIAETAKTSFYFGEAIARTQAALRELPDVNSTQWRESLPHGAGDAMQKELQTRLSAAGARRAMNLLLPLAYGRGDGIPWTAVWLPLANALRSEDAEPYDDSDLEWIRTHASSYVVQSETDEADYDLFRLYHETLSDFLRTYEDQSSGRRDQATDEHKIVRALLRKLGDGSRDWRGVAPYLRYHLLEHAAAGGDPSDIDELVLDPGFLAHGRSAELRAVLSKLTDPRHQAISDIYAAALAALLTRSGDTIADQTTESREESDLRFLLAQMSLAARCRGVDELAARIRLGNGADEAPWQATWAAWRQQSPHLRLTGFTDRVRAVTTATLADGSAVAVTAGDGGGIRIWDVLRGSLIRDIPRAHKGSIVALASGKLRDGTVIIVSTGDDYTAGVWDADTGRAVGSPVSLHDSPVHGVAVAQLGNGTVVLTGDDRGIVRVWNPRTGGQVRKEYHWEESAITAIALVDLGGAVHAVSAHHNGEVLTWSLIPRDPPRPSRRRFGNRPVRALAVGEVDGTPRVASAGDDGRIYLWNPASPVSQDSGQDPLAEHTDKIWALAMAEVNGRPAIVSAGADQVARVWDAKDGVPIGAPFTGHNAPIRDLTTAEAGNRALVISGGDDPMPRIWDLTAAGAANEPFTGHRNRIKSLLFTRINGRERIISGSSDSTVRRWDPDTGAMMGRPLTGHHQWVGALAVTDIAGHKCILSGGADTSVRFQDAASGADIREPLKHPAGVTALVVTSVGAETRVASACLDGTVLVWDVEAGVEVVRYLGHRDPQETQHPVWALSTVKLGSPDADPLVVSAGYGGVLHVWRPASGEVVLTEESGHPTVTALASVPGHSSWVASGGSDGAIRIRDLAGGSAQWRKHPEGSAVHALTLTSNGDTIVVTSAHADGTVQFSDLDNLGQIISHRAHLGHARALAADTSGDTAVVFSGGDDALIRVWDLERQAPFRVLHRSWVRSLAVITHPAGDPYEGEWSVVSGSDDDTIQIRASTGIRPGANASWPHTSGVSGL